MTVVFCFLASPAGRGARIVAGIALIYLGLWRVKGTLGWLLANIGLGPLAAGTFDVCLLAPFFGLPFFGPQLRSRLRCNEALAG